MGRTAAWLCGWMLVGGVAAAAGPAPKEPTVEELLRIQDDATRGASSQATMVMNVKTDRFERSLTMAVSTQGTEKTLVRILAPAKEKGTSTLKVDQNIWNYLPKVDRTIKVPASMMGGSWMGSHLSNDDLVREARFSEDFTCQFVQKPDGKTIQHYTIECIPKPSAAVVWGSVKIRVRAQDHMADQVMYLDESRARVVRTMELSDFALVGNRRFPKRTRVIPADKPTEYTEVIYQDITFDVTFPASTFTLQALKQ